MLIHPINKKCNAQGEGGTLDVAKIFYQIFHLA